MISSTKSNGIRVNAGCGMSPTPGWLNLDNSLTIRLGSVTPVARLLESTGALGKDQAEFAKFARDNGIQWADVSRHLPLPDGAADVVYSSHMLEHLDSGEAKHFLGEVRRVLKPSGVLRLALPDLSKLAKQYAETGDADRFVSESRLAYPLPGGILGRLQLLVIGVRHHRWMYDSASISKLLRESGFAHTVSLQPGETTIPNPDPLNLAERVEESLYVEARQIAPAI